MALSEQMIKETLYDFFFKSQDFTLDDYEVYQLAGDETGDYLQRQLTADIKKIENSAGLACRLDRTGRIFSFFYVINIENTYYIAVIKDLASETIDELEKFIIMEDITISKTDFIPHIYSHPNKDTVEINFYDGLAYLGLSLESSQNVDKVDVLDVLTGWPILNKTIDRKSLINETRLNEFAISYNKGCFLGQETASKIESRRGAAKYPVLVESQAKLPDEIMFNDKKVQLLNSVEFKGLHYSVVKVGREFLINNLEVECNGAKVHIFTYPLFSTGKKEISEYYYNEAVKLFHESKREEALALLDEVIAFNPEYADAYESKGVILGNNGEHQKAIEVMDELLKVDENSVMAHTNKSLYLMKLGKIEEAEEEKALATVASFKRFGNEAKEKQLREEQERVANEEKARRFEMFNKVLAIDELDVVANFGLADIHFSNEKFDKALSHLEIVLTENTKYSVAYLLKAKILFKQKKYDECLNVIEKGIPVATSQGELMPANEMQSLKAKIAKI